MAIKKKSFLSFFLSLLSVFIIVALNVNQNPFFEAFEAKSYDLRFRTMRGPVKGDPNIAIIALDEKSIKEIGRFPWSRKHYVKLIDTVSAAGAKALVMDAFFPETEDTAIDGKFGAALARAKNVTLAVAFDFNTDGSVKGITESIPVLRKASNGSAHMNFLPDEDGINRRNMLVVRHNGALVPSLGLKGAMAVLGEDDIRTGDYHIILGDRQIPIEENNAMWINHTGPEGSYTRYSFVDIVKGRIDPQELKGKLLFMGSTALGIYDMRVTSFHHNMPGVEIHATIADNIINRNHITRTSNEALLDLVIIVVLGLAAYFITARLKLYTAFPLLILLSVGYIWFSYFIFLRGHWLSMIYPLSSILLSYTISAGFQFITLDRRAKEMRSIFSSYVSPKIVDQLANDPAKAQIGGDTKAVTILFSDIKGFTTYSEKNEPFTVVNTLNEYLAAMTQVILKFDGTVDKFLGDGIMAYWGAPLPQEKHAELAVQCTLAMTNKIKQLTSKWQKSGTPPLSFRVGLNSGDVIAGNIGARGKKMEYTVIGDNVNLASRVEGTAKYYGVDILVSESTYS
ncbi:CHASE2 domain-containing protein, partial [Thermodesulfobacteriota bacterium]